MSQPCIEIALTPIKGRTIEDESTADGQAWTAIHKKLIEVPGYRGAAWGRQNDALDTLVFLVCTSSIILILVLHPGLICYSLGYLSQSC